MIFRNTLATAGFIGLALLTGAMVAQQEANPSPDSSRTEMQQKMKAKMAEKMKGSGMMGQMMAGHQEMADLMGKLRESMAALRSEKDSTALEIKLAGHAALLDQLQAKMSAQHSMMENMMQTMMAPDSGKASK
jgi:hypothetical protein